MDRRGYLASAGSVVAVLSGCVSEDEDGEGEVQQGSNSDSSDDGSNSASASSGGNNGGGGSEDAVVIQSHEFYSERFSAGVRGTARNTTDDTLDYVEINAVFLDSTGAQLDNGLDNTTDLRGGREWRFDAMYFGSDQEAIDSYEISAEWNRF